MSWTERRETKLIKMREEKGGQAMEIIGKSYVKEKIEEEKRKKIKGSKYNELYKDLMGAYQNI